MRPYLRLSSIFLFLFLCSCGNPYKDLRQTQTSPSDILKYKPVFDKELYRCTVDGRFLFKRFHLSGLLFFKTMPDATTRVVFQNEMGITFFDFEWNTNDSFQVNQVIEQLDKPVVLGLLEKDMNLLLMKQLKQREGTVLTRNDEVYYKFPLEKGVAYYIERERSLQRIENAGKKKVTTISLEGRKNNSSLADTIVINHHKANFTIRLHKLDQHANE